jgi:DNA polymerase-3 subunit epsilon/CBS domain-containing protein
MPVMLQSTPLIALRAAAIDTETTGLDVRKARLIEIGVLAIEGGEMLPEPLLDQLVDCGEPVPAASTAVHGIRSGDLAGKPAFPAVHADIVSALKDRVLIGHTVGFDLALLRRECERAGLAPLSAPALDVRVLAQLVSSQLSSYSLEGLAAWLGVEAGRRHRALGDAETAGLIFLALVPRLREVGIRTLAEATARCKMVTDAMAGGQPVEWDISATSQTAAANAGASDASLARLDHYPYRHRVSEVMNREPVLLPSETLLGAALKLIAERKLSSVLVGETLADAAQVGIVTERDIMRILAERGAEAFALPIGSFASRPLASVPEDALIYRAIGRMANRNIRHLAAVGADDAVVGVVTTRDLLKLRASSAIALGDDLDAARSVAELARAWAKLPAMARALRLEGVPARAIASVIAREVGALTRRAAQMAEAELAAGPMGPAPCDYAIVVLGSAGRGESLLAMDQDNAVIFAEGEPGGAEDQWFAAHGKRMCAILHEVGVPLCKGGVMASEPAFRGSLAEWRARIGRWLTRATPEDLLAVDIFFDFRAVHGRRALAHQLWLDAWAAARGEIAFLKLLAQSAGEGGSHLTMLGRVRTDEDGRIDIKGSVLKGVVTTARILALRHGVTTHATAARLSGLIERAHGGAADLSGFDEDHQLALDLVLEQQLLDIAEGKPPGNKVTARSLSARQTQALKAALARQGSIADLLRAELVD